jgi:glycosyltransferase involved in cell wall biosynthesis
MIKVAAFTSGRQIPASRFRVRQYVESLRAHGVELAEFCPVISAYPPKRKWMRPFWGLASLAGRLPAVARCHWHDVVLLQREMLSTFLTLEPLTRKPRVLDVDDAIWLNRGGSFAQRLAAISDSVICGNSFLAEYFGKWNSNITILPTAVDTDRFVPLVAKAMGEAPVIGWSGSSSGFADLQLAEKGLQAFFRKYPKARLRVIADQPPHLDLAAGQVEFVPWSPEAEVRSIQTLDVGIMPLRDTLWSRGKCAYKMLLYMSCGVPVVVSPVGMTGEVSRMGPIGACAATDDDWTGALEAVLANPQSAVAMGKNGRDVVLQNFSVHALAPKLAAELLRVAGCESNAVVGEVGEANR